MDGTHGLAAILRDAAQSGAAPQDEVGDIFKNFYDESEIFSTCLR
jgi:hypothetical protein